jgi:hypothetical protein
MLYLSILTSVLRRQKWCTGKLMAMFVLGAEFFLLICALFFTSYCIIVVASCPFPSAYVSQEVDRWRNDHAMVVECVWNLMAHGDAREGKWRGNGRMKWLASTLHTTSEHGISSITTADAHTSAASSRLNWRPHRFKWTRPFRRKTKSGFCACAIRFQKHSTTSCVVFL